MIFHTSNMFGSNDEDEILCTNESNNAPRMNFNSENLYKYNRQLTRGENTRRITKRDDTKSIIWMTTLKN